MLLWALLAGCSTQSGAVLEALGLPLSGQGAVSPTLDARFRYLRVGHGEHASYMMLGFKQTQAAGELEVWYSRSGETIKFLNGRLVGTAGLPTDWREVRLPKLPGWPEVPVEGLRYTREIDQMPGYRFGQAQTLHLRPVPPPADTRLLRLKADALSWFEETPVGAGANALPSARYAVDLKQSPAKVVYSEQCISAPLCFSFQVWPVPAQPDAPSEGKERP